ncbi:hypothetical protein BH09MYX1_BH09MYX1_29600 [soil metagenome]
MPSQHAPVGILPSLGKCLCGARWLSVRHMYPEMTMKRFALATLLFSCGGTVAMPPGSDASVDALTDAGWTPCSSPDGIHICNGSNQCTCPPRRACVDSLYLGGVAPCEPVFTPPSGTLEACAAGGGSDGWVCINFSPANEVGTYTEGGFNLGALFQSGGASDRVRYADFGTFTGEPLPEPSSCPDLGSSHSCGGACGGCSSGMRCVGRSPLHPVGVCLPPQPGCAARDGYPMQICAPTDGCFAFSVQPVQQKNADLHGVCLPRATCTELAVKLPGGGHCYAP